MVFEEQRRAQVPPTLTLSHTHTHFQTPSNLPHPSSGLISAQFRFPIPQSPSLLSDSALLIVLLSLSYSLFSPPLPSSSSLPRSLSSSIDTLHVWKRQDSVWKQDQVGGQESLLWPGDPGTPVSIPQCLAAPSSSPA